MIPSVWSRKIFPKVFGGVFGMLFFTKVTQASNVTAALNAAKEATLITTGVKDRVDKIKSSYANELVGYLKESNIHTETIIFGAIAKTARDKRVDFVYKGNAFSLTPNSMTIRIPF